MEMNMFYVKELLIHAKKFLDKKQFEEAKLLCQNVLRVNKENYLALVIIGKSFQDSHQAPLAFWRAIARKPWKLLAWQCLLNYFERQDHLALQSELFCIYDEMIKLQKDGRKIQKLLVKVTNLGCKSFNNESVSIIVRFINGQDKSRIKRVAEKLLLRLLKSVTYFKDEDKPEIYFILNDINTKYPSDAVKLELCRFILHSSDYISSLIEILQLDFFPTNLKVKIWTCERICEYYVINDSFDTFDIDQYIDFIAVGIESSKILLLLKSMVCLSRGAYLDAYNQCIPLFNYELKDNMEAVLIIKYTFMFQRWPETQNLPINFLATIHDPNLLALLKNLLMHSYLDQHKWSEALSISQEIPMDYLNSDDLALLEKCRAIIREPKKFPRYNQPFTHSDIFWRTQAKALMKKKRYDEAITVLQNCNEDSLKYFFIGKAESKKFARSQKMLRKSTPSL